MREGFAYVGGGECECVYACVHVCACVYVCVSVCERDW